MFLWKSLLICVGSYLSWAVRLVNVPALSDGPVLMLCSYVALLSTAVAVVLLALTAKSTDAFVTVVQTWLVAGTAISLLVSHAAKVRRAKAEERTTRSEFYPIITKKVI